MQTRTRTLLLMATATIMAYLIQGYGHTVLTSILTLKDFQAEFPGLKIGKGQPKHHATVRGMVVAAVNLGCAIGALIAFFAGDFTGRRRMITIGSFLAILGISLECSSHSIAQLLAGRLIIGFGIGSFTATIPTWLVECLKPKSRGFMIMFFFAFANMGTVMSSWINYGFYFDQVKNADWRVPMALQLVFAVSLFLVSWFIPESPRWLVKKQKIDQAASTLASIRGMSPDSDDVQAELAYIEQSTNLSHHSSGARNKLYYRAYLSIMLNVLCAFDGSNVITFYSTTILEDQLGYSPTLSRVLSACIQTGEMLGGFVASMLIDRVGRRPTMLFSGTAMFCSMLIIGVLSSIDKPAKAISRTIIAFQFIGMFCYPIGFQGTPHIYSAEIAPVDWRTEITAAGTFAHWGFNFAVPLITPPGMANIGYRYYLIYTVVNFVNIFCIFLLYPETNGISLDQLDHIFTEGKTPFNIVSLSRKFASDAHSDALEVPTRLISDSEESRATEKQSNF